jgi:hypothetical protein
MVNGTTHSRSSSHLHHVATKPLQPGAHLKPLNSCDPIPILKPVAEELTQHLDLLPAQKLRRQGIDDCGEI